MYWTCTIICVQLFQIDKPALFYSGNTEVQELLTKHTEIITDTDKDTKISSN